MKFNCKFCGVEFKAYNSKRKYCCLKCAQTDRDGTIEQRFLKKLSLPKTGGCIEWLGNLLPQGYGLFGAHGKSYRAHRFAWEREKGLIPDGMQILHTCDNRKCVNVRHLRIGTAFENIKDMYKKGRAIVGSKSVHAKLNEKQVIEIRSKLKSGYLLKEIAVEYHISEANVSLIKNNLKWKHIK